MVRRRIGFQVFSNPIVGISDIRSYESCRSWVGFRIFLQVASIDFLGAFELFLPKNLIAKLAIIWMANFGHTYKVVEALWFCTQICRTIWQILRKKIKSNKRKGNISIILILRPVHVLPFFIIILIHVVLVFWYFWFCLVIFIIFLLLIIKHYLWFYIPN